jgi:hypothetical protein
LPPVVVLAAGLAAIAFRRQVQQTHGDRGECRDPFPDASGDVLGGRVLEFAMQLLVGAEARAAWSCLTSSRVNVS